MSRPPMAASRSSGRKAGRRSLSCCMVLSPPRSPRASRMASSVPSARRASRRRRAMMHFAWSCSSPSRPASRRGAGRARRLPLRSTRPAASRSPSCRSAATARMRGASKCLDFEGQAFSLRALRRASRASIETEGPNLVALDVAGEGADEVPGHRAAGARGEWQDARSRRRSAEGRRRPRLSRALQSARADHAALRGER